jgi:hypothetical protein
MNSPRKARASSAGTRQPIDEVQRLARAVRAEAAYLRSLSLELRKQRRAGFPMSASTMAAGTEALDPELKVSAALDIRRRSSGAR